MSRFRVFLFLLLVPPMLGACSPIRIDEARLLLTDIAAGDGPSDLKESTPEPVRTTYKYKQRGRDYSADIYLPGDDGDGRPVRAGIVLVPGLAPAGKDEPRIIALAKSFARVRFAVLVPDLNGLKQTQASPEDAQGVGDAVLALSDRIGHDSMVGVAAISYAVGPALLAALDDEVAEHVRFVFGVGGYYDSTTVITFFTTGKYRENQNSPWRYLEPNVYGKWVFLRNNAGLLDDPNDRRSLWELAQRKLREPGNSLFGRAPQLGPEGHAVLNLVENKDPERVPELIAALPATIRADIAALNLARQDLSRLRAKLILVHGRDDSIIPWTESARLAAAAPAGSTDLYLVDNISHVDMEPAGLIDSFKLWSAAYRLLEERED